MVTYLGGSILITIFALSGSIVSYNLQKTPSISKKVLPVAVEVSTGCSIA